MLVSVLAVIFVFGLIVFVHEFGHMMAAKLCGNAVPHFALGMGPSLISRMWRGTRFHICLLPVGGFVQVAGLDSEDDPSLPVSAKWQARTGWQKAFILVSGVLMNMVLALVTVIVMGLVGFPQNVVRVVDVRPDSPGAAAGLRVGDVIISGDNHRFSGSRQFTAFVRAHKDVPVRMQVYRDGAEIGVDVTPRSIPGFNNGLTSVGLTLEEDLYSTTEISLVQPKSIGDQLNFKIGDRVLAVNGKPVTNGWDVIRALPMPDPNTLAAVDANGKPIPPGGGTPIEIVIGRDAKHLGLAFNPDGSIATAEGESTTKTDSKLPSPRLLGVTDGIGRLQYTLPGDATAVSLGVQFKPQLLQLPFGESIARSLRDGAVFMVSMLYSMKLIFTTEGVKSVSGPVGLVRMIGQSASSDWYTFLQIILLINLNLAILNLMPLPALDGGRLVFVALAGIGIRISEKREALVHAIGMATLLGLIGLVTFSDLLAMF